VGKVYDPSEVEEVPSAPEPRPSARDVAAGQLAETEEPAMASDPASRWAALDAERRDAAKPFENPHGLDSVAARMRGLAQRASLGGVDEAVGLGKAIVGKGKGAFWERYRGGRDEYREGDKKAAALDPAAVREGEAISTLLPTSLAARARTGLARFLGGTAEGTAMGVLGSEHDLTTGAPGERAGVAKDAAVGLGIGMLASLPGAAGSYAKSGNAERSMQQIEGDAERAAMKAAKKGKEAPTFVNEAKKSFDKKPLSSLVTVPLMSGDAAVKNAREAVVRMLGHLQKAARSGATAPARLAAFTRDLLAAGATEREIRLALDGGLTEGDQ
jgi:hypothetical protein